MATASFDAFISYSRSASASLASDLQLSTERYAKPWNRLRSARLFRDDSSMSANSGFETGLRWNLFDDPLSGVIWLDDDRVFAYSDQGGRAVVLSGSELRTEELIWDMQLGKLGSPDDDDESATLYDAAGDQVYRDPMSMLSGAFR